MAEARQPSSAPIGSLDRVGLHGKWWETVEPRVHRGGTIAAMCRSAQLRTPPQGCVLRDGVRSCEPAFRQSSQCCPLVAVVCAVRLVIRLRPQQVDLWVRVRGTPFPHINHSEVELDLNTKRWIRENFRRILITLSIFLFRA